MVFTPLSAAISSTCSSARRLFAYIDDGSVRMKWTVGLISGYLAHGCWGGCLVRVSLFHPYPQNVCANPNLQSRPEGTKQNDFHCMKPPQCVVARISIIHKLSNCDIINISSLSHSHQDWLTGIQTLGAQLLPYFALWWNKYENAINILAVLGVVLHLNYGIL